MTPLSLGIFASANFTIPTSFESIATISGTGSSGTITFSNIPGTYQHLQIRYIAKSTQSATDVYGLDITFNGSSATYARHYITGSGSTVTAVGNANESTISDGGGVIPGGASAIANIHGVGILDITDYTSTTKAKTLRYLTGADLNRETFPQGRVTLASGLWFATPTAITSITFTLTGSGNFTTTSSFALYGIKGA